MGVGLDSPGTQLNVMTFLLKPGPVLDGPPVSKHQLYFNGSPMNSTLAPHGLAALRIASGLAFMSHGLQKIFGLLGGFGPDGGTVELMSRFGLAGMIELAAGVLITIGLFTRAAAFVASGEMAVAYFWMHAAGSGSIWWWANRGEVAMLYAFIFCLLAVAGPGALSLDGKRISAASNG